MEKKPKVPKTKIPETPAAPEPGKVEALLKMAGLDMAEIAKLLEPLMLQSAAKLLNGMKIPEAIAAAVEKKINVFAVEVKASLARVEASQQAALGQPAAPAAPAGGLGDTLVAALAKKIIGGGGNNGLKEMFEGMKGFMEMTATLYQGPRYQAQKEIIDIMKAGYAIGLETKQVIEGAEKGLGKGLGGIAKSATQP